MSEHAKNFKYWLEAITTKYYNEFLNALDGEPHTEFEVADGSTIAALLALAED